MKTQHIPREEFAELLNVWFDHDFEGREAEEIALCMYANGYTVIHTPLSLLPKEQK